MKMSTEVGHAAEAMVAEYLSTNDFDILARNWRTPACEIDIITRQDNVIYFVEVKYRRTTRYGDGFSYITPAKLKHMRRAAEIWLQQHDWDGECSMAVAAIEGDGSILEFITDIGTD